MRVPVAREGWPFVLAPGIAAVGLWLSGHRRAAVPFTAASLASLGFFRDPEREIPSVPGGLLAPADGKVVEIREVVDSFVGEATRVSIFLSPLDVHVNRSPLAGLVTDVDYRPGRFLAAYRSEASEVNEQCTLALQGEAARVTVRQIAGVLARRIVCRARPGDKLAAGERFGMIRFGSRTELVIPRGTRLRVREGDRVRGGESVIGVLP
jgi:phosphatidylserine decarboxylase